MRRSSATVQKNSKESPLFMYALSTLSSEFENLDERIKTSCKNILMDLIIGNIETEVAINYFSRYSIPIDSIILINNVLKIVSGHDPSTVSKRPAHYNRKCRSWSQQEDLRLLAGIHKYGLGDWKSISAFVGGERSRSQCSQRWGRALNPNLSKISWTDEEDKKLLDLVFYYGEHSWSQIAKMIGSRSDVQCRYRFYQIRKSKQKGKKDRICSPKIIDAQAHHRESISAASSEISQNKSPKSEDRELPGIETIMNYPNFHIPSLSPFAIYCHPKDLIRLSTIPGIRYPTQQVSLVGYINN